MVFIEKSRDGIVSAVTDVEVCDVVCGQNHVVSLLLLGCVECMSCRQLLPMFAVSVSLSIHLSVSLSVCQAAQLVFTVQKWLN